MDLRDLINTLDILNIDEHESTISKQQFSSMLKEDINKKFYVVSDADEELLILVAFKKIIHLHSLKIYALSQSNDSNMSSPKQVHIYKLNNLDINFDDIKSMKSDKSIKCSAKKLQKGQNINFMKSSKHAIKFKKIQFLAIYIESNQKDTELTFINGLTFKGEPDHLHENNKIIIEHKTDISQHTDPIKSFILNSQHLLCQSNVHQKPSKGCKLTTCLSLRNIMDILKAYHICQHSKQHTSDDNEGIYYNIHTKYDDYNDVHLLNDFNHLLSFHSDEFEDIYDILVNTANNKQTCDVSTCLLMKRNHHRNRSEITQNESLLRTLYLTDDGIISQQFVDRIHSYYFHSFDIGYKITSNNRERIRKNIESNKRYGNANDCQHDLIVTEIAEFIKYKNKLHNEVYSEHTKMVTKIEATSCANHNLFDFGYRYFYWKYYKYNNDSYDSVRCWDVQHNRKPANKGYVLSDWYITPLFNNFKDEMLNNHTCCISLSDWDILNAKAIIHSKTEHAKTILCSTKYCEVIYEIHKNTKVTINHLISLMLYCNYDVLQSLFSETYRRIPYNETDVSLKKRHSDFGYLGKYLRECTECFGTITNQDSDSIAVDLPTLYHGINAPMQFSSIIAYIKGPFSTTTDYTVAANFCNNEGVILEFVLDFSWFDVYSKPIQNKCKCSFFDCQWISDYPNEQEILFVGGYSQFLFQTIIAASIGVNYEQYVKALGRLSIRLENYSNVGAYYFDKHINQILFRLLSHELHIYYPNNPKYKEFKYIPPFIEQLLHNHCETIIHFHLTNERNRDERYETKMLKQLFCDQDGWLNLTILTKIFASLETIKLDIRTEACLNENIYKSMVSFLSKNKSGNLKYIELMYNETMKQNIQQRVEQYKQQFVKYQWDIYDNEGKCGPISFQASHYQPPSAKLMVYGGITYSRKLF